MKKHTLLTLLLLSVIFFGAISISTYAKSPKEKIDSIEPVVTDEITDKTTVDDTFEEAESEEKQTYYYNSNEISSDWTNSLELKIRDQLGDDINKVGFIYYNLNSGEKIAINENEIVVAASTCKMGMNVVAYEMVKNNELSLDEDLFYDSSFYTEGTGLLQYKLNGLDNKPLKVQYLLNLTIIESDNIATNMIFNRLGGKPLVREKMNDLVGLTCITDQNRTTTEIQYRLLRFIYEHRNEPNYAHLIESMKNTVFNDAIDKYIPKEISAHKVGFYDKSSSDIGLIDTKNPYIFVMYTEDVYDPDEVIAKLSKLVYDEHQAKYQ